MSAIEEKSSTKSFGGFVKIYTHNSSEVKTPMTFAVYLPPQAENQKCPVLYWLSGLSCTEQNFITKGGALKAAAELGIIIVAPDTSPRGANIEGEDENWDFGTGAGFYVDATTDKWKNNYRMYSYVIKELREIVEKNFPTNGEQSISGHSMGGHGAIVCALKNPGLYKSVSAFAPICNPVICPWGDKAFSGYLGANKEEWKQYDSCELVAKYEGPNLEIMSDQGSKDGFLAAQLFPDNLVKACEPKSNLKLFYQFREGYDHGYYFVSTFMEDHVRFHAKHLAKKGLL